MAGKVKPHRAYIVEAYKLGQDGPTLARRFDVHVTSIYQVLKDAGVERRPRGTLRKGMVPWNKGKKLKKPAEVVEKNPLESFWPEPKT